MQVGGWGCSFLQAISSPNCGLGAPASSRRGFPASLRLADPLCRIVGAAEKRHPAQTPLPPPPQRAPKQLEQKFNARRTPRGQEQAEGKDKEPPEGGKASGGAEGATIPSTRCQFHSPSLVSRSPTAVPCLVKQHQAMTRGSEEVSRHLAHQGPLGPANPEHTEPDSSQASSLQGFPPRASAPPAGKRSPLTRPRLPAPRAAITGPRPCQGLSWDRGRAGRAAAGPSRTSRPTGPAPAAPPGPAASARRG